MARTRTRARAAPERSGEPLAASLAAAFAAAFGDDAAPPWGMLAPEAQAGWRRLAAQGEGVLAAADGGRFDAIGLSLRALWDPEAPAPPPGEALKLRLAWEAVARHLWVLLEADDADPALRRELEESWRDWARRRLQHAETP